MHLLGSLSYLPTGVPSLATHLEGRQLSWTFCIAVQRRESRNACQHSGLHLPRKKQMQVISQGSFSSLETSGSPGEGLQRPGRRKQNPQLAGPLQTLACDALQLLGSSILPVQTLHIDLHHTVFPPVLPVCRSQSSGRVGPRYLLLDLLLMAWSLSFLSAPLSPSPQK